MVYGFENRKPISDFEHLILKLTYLAKIHPRLDRDLTGTYPGLDRDQLGTCSGPAQDLTGTCPRLDRDLLET